MTSIETLDYVGVALFAATGALATSRKQLDIIGFLFLAAVTGIGGGTICNATQIKFSARRIAYHPCSAQRYTAFRHAS